MGNQFLYGGVQTPYWQQIDKIFVGSETSLQKQAETDDVMLGRYILLQYVENKVYTQDQRNRFINGIDDPENNWLNFYNTDGEDYDGVVFKKIYTDKLQYKPIARLNTNISTDYIDSTIAGNTYLRGELYSKDEIDNQNSALESTLKSYTDTQVQALLGGEVDEAYNTFLELQKILEGESDNNADGVIGNLATLNEQYAQLNGNLMIIDNEVSNNTIAISRLSEDLMFELELNEFPALEDAALNTIYKVLDSNGTTATIKYATIDTEGEKVWKVIGVTTISPITWETF